MQTEAKGHGQQSRRTAWGWLGDSFESPLGESEFHSVDSRKPFLGLQSGILILVLAKDQAFLPGVGAWKQARVLVRSDEDMG